MAFTLEAVSLILKLRHLVKVVVITISCIASDTSFAKFQTGYALLNKQIVMDGLKLRKRTEISQNY